MKILLLSHAQYITIGLPKIIELAENLSVKGHQVTIVVTSKNNRLKLQKFSKNSVRYILSPSLLWGRFRHGADLWDLTNRIIYLLTHFDFDIVHCIDSRPTVILPGIILKKIKKIPLILEWSDLYSNGGSITERSNKFYQITFGRIESFFEVFFRKYADGATAITIFLKNKLLELGFDKHNILIHRMGCIVDNSKLENKEKARQRLSLPQGKILCTYLGRIYKRDLQLLHDSFQLIFQTRIDIELLIVGDIDTKLRIPFKGIRYLGKVERETYRDLCNATDFFVLPMMHSQTNMARWPSKIGDYLSFGKPIVSTKVSDFEEIFLNNDIGILSKLDSPEAYAQAIHRMINSKSFWKKWGENSYNYAKNNLDWNIISCKLIEFYQKIINDEESNI